MGSGAGVLHKCNTDNLVDYYTAGRGYSVIDGRSVDYYLEGRWGDQDASINDRAARHAAILANDPGQDYDVNLADSDETTGINYDTDSPYEETYDGDMTTDHPMVMAMMGRTPPNADGWATPDEHEMADNEMTDGWLTPVESTSPTSEPWEPITNTRGHDRVQDPYNWDWIPDFETESDEPCKYPRDLKSRVD